MIQITLLLIDQSDKHLLNKARKRESDSQALCCVQRVSKILFMKPYTETRLEISAEHHRRFGIEDGASG